MGIGSLEGLTHREGYIFEPCHPMLLPTYCLLLICFVIPVMSVRYFRSL